MKVILTQELHVRDPQYKLSGPAWAGQRTADMPVFPQKGDEIAIGSGSHRPTVEAVIYIARTGWYHVLLSAIKVHDPARLDTEIEEQKDLGFREAFFAS